MFSIFSRHKYSPNGEKWISDRVKSVSGRVKSVSDRVKSPSGREKSVSDGEKSASGREKWFSNGEKSVSDREKWISDGEKSASGREKWISNLLEIHFTNIFTNKSNFNKHIFFFINNKSCKGTDYLNKYLEKTL